MLTKAQLEENYKQFSDARVVELANEPDGLSDEAIEVLHNELRARQLNIRVQPQSIQDPTEFIPEPSEALTIMYPNALQIFSFQLRMILVASLVFLFLGSFLVFSSTFSHGLFSILKYIGFLFLILAAYIWINVRSKKAMLVVSQDEILFQQKWFPSNRKLIIVDLIRLFFSAKLHRIKKSDIQAIVRPTAILRVNNFYFLTIKGEKLEINFFASEEYFDQLHAYLENYLKN